MPFLFLFCRAQIQRVFFPPSYHDTKPTPLLQPGDLRTCTCLKVFFEFSGTTTLHVPFREASKVCINAMCHGMTLLTDSTIELAMGWANTQR